MTNTALATTTPSLALADLTARANILAASKMVPERYQGEPDQIVAAALYGQELGLSPVVSLKQIVVIGDEPTLKAEAMRALVYANGLGSFDIIEAKNQQSVTVTGYRPCKCAHASTVTKLTRTFSMTDAHRAELCSPDEYTITRGINKGKKARNLSYSQKAGWYPGPWYQVPVDMMIARATAAVCRGLFPDALAGVSYTPEEMAAVHDVPLDVVEGEVVVMGDLAETTRHDVIALIHELVEKLGLSDRVVREQCMKLYGHPIFQDLGDDDLDDLLGRLHKKLMQANRKDTV